MVCFSRLILVALAFSLQSIEYTVDEAWAFFGAELPGQIDGLGNHNLPLLGGLGHLLRGEAQDGTVQDRLAVQWPVGAQRIEFIIQRSTAFPCPQREIDALGSVGFGGRTAFQRAVKLSGIGSPPRSKMYRAWRAARQQSLATLIATPPWWTRPRSPQPWPRNPCCLGCRRLRASAWARVLAVITPNPTGLWVVMASWVQPCAMAWAITSSWMVSPLMMQPKTATPSNPSWRRRPPRPATQKHLGR